MKGEAIFEAFFWVVTQCICAAGYPEDGGSMDLRNFRVLPQHYTASQSARPRLESKEKVVAYFKVNPRILLKRAGKISQLRQTLTRLKFKPGTS
jgi:hypothetical protein